jgi:hypothetical protein
MARNEIQGRSHTILVHENRMRGWVVRAWNDKEGSKEKNECDVTPIEFVFCKISFVIFVAAVLVATVHAVVVTAA